MLSVRPKINELNFHLFARSVHPELFEVCETRTYVRDAYSLKLNITRDGHAICFQHAGGLLTEISAGALRPLPTQELLLTHAIQKPNHNVLRHHNVVYQSSVEMEAVPLKAFITIRQQLDESPHIEGLIHRFESNGRVAFGAISYINVQSFASHVLVRALHTFPDTCAVLKSESRFSVK